MLSSPSTPPRWNRKLILGFVLLAIAAILSLGVIVVYVVRSVIPPYLLDTVVYASLFGLMALGLTLTYLTTKVPNFAYGSFVTIGIYTSFTLYKVDRINPYFGTPIGFLLGGLSSVAMYLGVLRVLARRGSSLVALMISTFAVDIGFLGILQIYTDQLYYHYYKFDAKDFFPLGTDYSMFRLPGMLYVAPVSLGLITAALFLLLTKTKFGVAMRASVENPGLARVLGIDVEKVYTFAWFLAGGFAATAGTFYPIWLPASVNEGSVIIVETFASSVLGGLSSVYG